MTERIDIYVAQQPCQKSRYNYRIAISRPAPLIAGIFVGGVSAVKILQPRDGAMCCTFFII